MRVRLGVSAVVALALMLAVPSASLAHHRRHHHHKRHHRHHHKRHHRRHTPAPSPRPAPTPAPAPTPTPTPPPRPVLPCPAAGSATLANSSAAYVYSLNGDVFGCVVDGTTQALGSAGPGCLGADTGVVGDPTVTGDLAAYSLCDGGVDNNHVDVVVERLTNGVGYDASATPPPYGPESFQSVASIVLDADGGVAWIGQISGIGMLPNTYVIKYDSGGESVLDSGSGIDPKSLALSGSTLTWDDGGVTYSATLN